MSYRVEVTPEARRDLRRLDPPAARRVLRFLGERVAVLDDPRSLGAALVGSPLWRYRVGDLRIVVSIEDSRLVVLVLEIGHRREIYR